MWEVMYACVKNDAPNEVILSLVERFVNRTYRDSVEELKESNLIDEETEEKAKEQSNIEKIANAITSSTVNSIDSEEPNITADYAILIEASTGRVIYEKNADEKAYPASTTKMLTCVLAIEKGDLDKTLSVSQRAAWTEDPYVGFQQGDMLKERDLLKA